MLVAIFSYGFSDSVDRFAEAKCPFEVLTDYPTMLEFEDQVRSYLRAKLGMLHASTVPNILSALWGAEFPPSKTDHRLVRKGTYVYFTCTK